MNQKTREARIRRALARLGYALQKSRARLWNLDDQGGYRVIKPNRNFIVVGARFEWTLDDIEAWLAD
jgi:hypothetical protein